MPGAPLGQVTDIKHKGLIAAPDGGREVTEACDPVPAPKLEVQVAGQRESRDELAPDTGQKVTRPFDVFVRAGDQRVRGLEGDDPTEVRRQVVTELDHQRTLTVPGG